MKHKLLKSRTVRLAAFLGTGFAALGGLLFTASARAQVDCSTLPLAFQPSNCVQTTAAVFNQSQLDAIAAELEQIFVQLKIIQSKLQTLIASQRISSSTSAVTGISHSFSTSTATTSVQTQISTSTVRISQ